MPQETISEMMRILGRLESRAEQIDAIKDEVDELRRIAEAQQRFQDGIRTGQKLLWGAALLCASLVGWAFDRFWPFGR